VTTRQGLPQRPRLDHTALCGRVVLANRHEDGDHKKAAVELSRVAKAAWEEAAKASYALGVAQAERVKTSRTVRLARAAAKQATREKRTEPETQEISETTLQAEAAEREAWEVVRRAEREAVARRMTAEVAQATAGKALDAWMAKSAAGSDLKAHRKS
jgi:hypothetical protein